VKYLAALLLSVTACSSGTPTNSTCPTTDPPTYQNFGQAFFGSYCTSCHSAESPNRHGAPSDQNYDSEAAIMTHLTDIDVEAAGGPDAMNTSMPELGGTVMTKPTEAERQRLGEYLACLQSQ